jgi:hypothetical protein
MARGKVLVTEVRQVQALMQDCLELTLTSVAEHKCRGRAGVLTDPIGLVHGVTSPWQQLRTAEHHAIEDKNERKEMDQARSVSPSGRRGPRSTHDHR